MLLITHSDALRDRNLTICGRPQPFSGSKITPKWFKKVQKSTPRRLQDGPSAKLKPSKMMFNLKSTSRTPKRPPRGPKRPPRGLQEASKRPPEGPQGSQEAAKKLPNDFPKHLKDNVIQCHIIQLTYMFVFILNIILSPYLVAYLLSDLLTCLL